MLIFTVTNKKGNKIISDIFFNLYVHKIYGYWNSIQNQFLDFVLVSLTHDKVGNAHVM
jgi:hypothetical protein